MLIAVLATLGAISSSGEEPGGSPDWVGRSFVTCLLLMIVMLLISLLLTNVQHWRKNHAYMDAAARQNDKVVEVLEEIRGELRDLNERLTRIALGGQQDTVVQPTDVTARRPGP
jgi:hypothetical protein